MVVNCNLNVQNGRIGYFLAIWCRVVTVEKYLGFELGMSIERLEKDGREHWYWRIPKWFNTIREKQRHPIPCNLVTSSTFPQVEAYKAWTCYTDLSPLKFKVNKTQAEHNHDENMTNSKLHKQLTMSNSMWKLLWTQIYAYPKHSTLAGWLLEVFS